MNDNVLAVQRRVLESALSTHEKLVALALLSHWSRTGATFPSVPRLAALASCDDRTVQRALERLEAKGAIAIRRRYGKSSTYELGGLALLPPADSHPRQRVTGPTPGRESPVLPPAESHPGQRVTGPTPDGESPVSPPAESHPRHRVTGPTPDTLPGTPGTESPLPPAESHPEVIHGTDPVNGSISRERTRGVTKAKAKVPKWRKVPEAWEPQEQHRTLAAELGVQFELELAKFRDHEFNKPRSDPDSAFRNWLRNAESFGAARRPAPRVQQGSMPQDVLERARARGEALARG